MIDSQCSHSDSSGGGLASPVDQWGGEITWVLAQRDRLRFCFALLRICAECRDWRDTGDIYGFIDVYNRSFVIYTCLYDCCDVDVCVLMLCLFKSSECITKRGRGVIFHVSLRRFVTKPLYFLFILLCYNCMCSVCVYLMI